VWFIAGPTYPHLSKGIGEFVRAPANVADVVAAVLELTQPAG
jgi:hypothetical protein